MIKIVDNKNIVEKVKKELEKAKREILATMLLQEEFISPLPASYHNLLRRKVKQGAILKRLGFGTRVEYAKIKERYKIDSKNYFFRYRTDLSKYQRLLIIDREKLFFKAAETFFETQNKELINSFVKYFIKEFKEGKL